LLNRLELLASLLGAWIIAGIGYSIIKHKRRKILPKGSIIIEKEISGVENKKLGSRWAHIGIIIGMGSTTVLLILAVLLSIFNIWESTSSYIAFNFPSWINWIVIIGIWTCYGWGTLVMAYNVNYTPLFKPMEGKYVLATGGP